MDKILSILVDIKPEFDFSSSEDFIVDGMLDSFDIVSLVTELEEKFDIFIDALDILPENFGSVEAITNVIRKNGGTV
ncbi:acyl carrier protein [Lysinibacillus sp. FSL R7-0073]|uniref:acyl carrier protein n=1 Tax=Lysinibacillus TaxID=400634 RepID=UPI002E1AD1DF|nr:acyl carrier protein [Lysinibacillus fusiformis]